MSLYEEELELEQGWNYHTFPECKNDKHPDDHWYRAPLCQRVINDPDGWRPSPRVCGDDDWVFEHNDIVNLDCMDRKHEMVIGDPLTDENTRRRNDCRGYIDHSWETDAEGNYTRRKDEKCDCRCHWGGYYVNTYEVDRGYGGPEEGGWWYDLGKPVASVPFETLREAEAWQDTMEERFPHTGTSSSVIYSGGDYRTHIERGFAEPWPDRTPRYE